MAHLKFDLAKLERLNDPGRFEDMDPARMWRALGDPQPHTIIDIGAGTGLFATRFAEMAPDSTIYAADMAPQMVEWMTANRPEVAAGRIVPVLSTETAVPLDDGIADVVVMINLHHELADAPATYTDAIRLLRPGGQLLVVEWAPGESPHGPPQHVRVTGEEIASVLAAAGFVDVTVHDPLPWHSIVTGCRDAV